MTAAVIPPFRLKAEPLTEEGRGLPGFLWAEEGIGKRHQIGGTPDPVPSNDGPNCPACDAKMTFYSQLDAVSSEFPLADCGLIHVHICFDCFEVSAELISF